ncbi:MAG TPA: glycosyltransferase family 1 protein [Acidocella sp.]|jgi:glycosyltransferase involved in cell wall biosynthesis|nr:glycosyltransferase family 1 protein [Acidocella sp.]
MLSLAHRAWRLLPRDARRAAMTRVASLVAVPPDLPPPKSEGAVIAGDINGKNGIAESGRILGQALAVRGLMRGTMPLGLPSVVPAYTGTLAPGAAIIAVLNGPLLPVGLARLQPRNMLRGRRIIGVWAWELSRVPAEWAVGAKFVHEIWAPTRFAAEAFTAVAPGRVRVVPFPLATQLPFAVTGDRASFGLPANRFIVLSAFNLASSCTRKNPLGTIAAFKAAFGASQDALLVLKLTGIAHYQDDLAAIHAAVGDAPNIRVMTETVSEPELRGLIAASDVVLSLHRSEGFGLIPATAALLGVPVVATGYSGNLDFMDSQCSGLVSYRLVPVQDERGVYAVPGAEWAEPDIEDAASWLRRLFEAPALRAEMGAAGQRHAMNTLGREALDAALAANGIG